MPKCRKADCPGNLFVPNCTDYRQFVFENRIFHLSFCLVCCSKSELTKKGSMAVSVVLFSLVIFLVRFRLSASYSFNIDMDLTSAKKIVYSGDADNGEYAFGEAVDTNQDFNGDGFNDIIVGVPSASVAYLFFGGNTIPSVPSVKFIGKPSTAFSEICRFAGDVNNDGYADIIFGVLTEVVRETYLVFGGPSTPSTYSVTEINPRTIKYAPDASNFYNSLFCGGVAGVGDTNKDGFDDFVICAYSQDLGSLINAGACYLIYGATNLQSISMRDLGSGGIRIYGTESNQNFGHVVAAAGDINGDGYADFFIQNGNREYVFLIYGGASLPSSFSTTVDIFFPGSDFPQSE
jgi:hypothetical protein